MNVQVDKPNPTTASTLLRGSRRGARLRDLIFGKIIQIHALSAIAIIILIFIYVGKEALPIFTDKEIRKEANPSLIFLPQHYGTEDAPLAYSWQPVSEVPKYSIMPLFVGTLKVTLIALLFAAPLAIAAAIFTAEFAPPRLREILKPVIELLAGIPSVVLGFLALIVTASWLQDTLHLDYRLNALNAGIAMGLAILPVIYTVCEDALTAVPQTYREASLALGVQPWKTALYVVLPAALPGIFAAMVLGFGRAIGETMIVLMASGNAAINSWQFTDSVRTLSATIAAELGEVVFGSSHYHVLFFLGATLFIVTFILNFLGDWFIKYFRRRMMGT